MNGTVWALSEGEYSDYSVLCVCPSKEDAEALLARYTEGMTYPSAFIEEIEVADRNTVARTVLHMTCEVLDNGTVRRAVEHESIEWPFGWEPATAVRWRWVRAPYFANKGGRLNVDGSDFDAVRRTYSDKRARLLADPVFRAQNEAEGRRR